MDNETRDLCLTLSDGDLTLLPIVHGLTEAVHFKRIAAWLVKNKITGKELKHWYINRFKMRKLSMISYIVMKINKETEMRKLYAGKDIIIRA